MSIVHIGAATRSSDRSVVDETIASSVGVIASGVRSVRTLLELLLGVSAVRCGDSRTGVSSVVRRSQIRGGSTTASSKTGAAKLSFLLGSILGLALPKLALATTVARGVVVGGRRTVAAFLLVAAGKGNLHKRSDEEENSANDGDGKRCSVESASQAEVGRVGQVLATAETKVVGTDSVGASLTIA